MRGDGKRHRFGEDHSITPGMLQIIAEIANRSLTTFAEREEKAKPFYEALKRATEKSKTTKPESETAGLIERRFG